MIIHFSFSPSPVPAKQEDVQDHKAIEDKPCTSEQAKLQTIQQTFENAGHNIESTSPDKRKFPDKNKQHFCIVCGQNFKSAQELGRHTRNCQPTVIASVDPKQLDQLKQTTNEQGEKLWLCDLCEFR